MVAAPKGKQGTKGSKQIVEENVATLKFYRNMAAGGSAIYLLFMFIIFDMSGFGVIMSIISIGILIGSYQFMSFMCRPKLSESGGILDSGSDLNLEGGIAEHVKDLIILTTGTQLLSLGSEWFWLLLLLAPARAVWMLWGSIIKPWLSQRNDQQQGDVDEKKQRKLDRKMKRQR